LPGAGSAPLLLAPAMLFGFAVPISRQFDAARSGPRFFDIEELTPAGAQRTVSINNLKQIGLAMHNFHDVHKHFPIADGAGSDGKPKLSWRVHILPFIEEHALFQQFHLDEPWDSEHNKKLIESMPAIYRTPGSRLHQKHMTNYLTVRGKDMAFPPATKTSMAHLRDGTSNTAMVLEVSDERAVIWTKPDDFEPDKDDPLKGVVGLRDGKFLVVFADGSVRTLSASLNKDAVRAMFTRDGGEVVELEN